MQRLKPALPVFLFFGAILVLTASCSPMAEPMSQATPVPPEVLVLKITEEETVLSEVTQHQAFDQCGASSAFETEAEFSQSEGREAQQKLVLGGSLGGELGVSAVAKVKLEASLEQHFASLIIHEKGYRASVKIEVPPHTKQEYTLVWNEIRRKGTIQYLETGMAKTVDYNYRIGMELAFATGKDLDCPGQQSAQAMPTGTPVSTSTTAPTPRPADVRLTSDLEISQLSPSPGEPVKATFKVRNYGEQTFTAVKFLVKGRGPDGSIQDFGPVDNFSLNPGTEYAYIEYRTFSAPGQYWFTPHYSPNGVSDWSDVTWLDNRTSYVYINVVPDYPPQVTLSVEPSTLYKKAELAIKVTASDDVGLQFVRWWSVGTGDESLSQGQGGEFVYDVRTGSFDKSWSLTWNGEKGKFTIYAQARDTAGQLSNIASTMITVLPTEKFSLLSGGGPFDDISLQVALRFAINWGTLREEIGEVVLVDFLSGETLAGPTEPAYNPNLARRLLTEAGHSRFDTVLLYDSGDEPAIELAEEVARYLNAAGISVKPRGVAQPDARSQFDTMIAGGESGLFIERR